MLSSVIKLCPALEEREKRKLQAEKVMGSQQQSSISVCVPTENINQERDTYNFFFPFATIILKRRLLVSLTNIYQVKFLTVCEIISVICMENFVTAFPTPSTSFSFSRIHPSGHNLEWLLHTAVNTHLPIKFKLNLLFQICFTVNKQTDK